MEVHAAYTYIIKFCMSSEPEKCWRQMFTLKEKLEIGNLLQLVEICIVLPISNAEMERVFSTFSKMMTQDR